MMRRMPALLRSRLRSNRVVTNSLSREIDAVVDNGNCSGCGACALLSTRVAVSVDEGSGFLRPTVSPPTNDARDAQEAAEFRAICPGIGVELDADGRAFDPDFGPYVSVWEGWASDPQVRLGGSSGGVLTAMAKYALESQSCSSVIAARADVLDPSASENVTVEDASLVNTLAGSRYAPVSTVAGHSQDQAQAVVGKPCELSALGALERLRGNDPSLKLGFFCAGTPSQHATDQLVLQGGLEPRALSSLRYRGDGWPGTFRAYSDKLGAYEVSYAEAWGSVLGRQIESRCRICPDGTGTSADISAGDFWQIDEKGYPLFTESDGKSAVIARTQRGHDLLMDARAAGQVILRPVSMDAVTAVQPAQIKRQRTIAARLAARRLLGYRVPEYRGFRVKWQFLRRPVLSFMYFGGTLARSKRIATKHSHSDDEARRLHILRKYW